MPPTGTVIDLSPGPVGIMADLHANRLAVEAVIDEAGERGVGRWIVLGDVVAMGPEPAAVLRLLDHLDVLVAIAGNTERYVLTEDRPPPTATDVAADPSLLPTFAEVAASFAWTRGFLAASGELDTLRSYLPSATIRLPDGTEVLAVHASLAADDGVGITPDGDENGLDRLFAGSEAALTVGGHTHRRTDRLIGGRRFVNPGSVSNRHGKDTSAQYAILHCGHDDHRVEFHSVGYDADEVRRRIADCGIPGAEYLLETYFA